MKTTQTTNTSRRTDIQVIDKDHVRLKIFLEPEFIQQGTKMSNMCRSSGIFLDHQFAIGLCLDLCNFGIKDLFADMTKLIK